MARISVHMCKPTVLARKDFLNRLRLVIFKNCEKKIWVPAKRNGPPFAFLTHHGATVPPNILYSQHTCGLCVRRRCECVYL